MDKPKPISSGALFRQLIFSAFKVLLLVALSWGVGAWLKAGSSSWQMATLYFANPYRIFFLASLLFELVFEYFFSPRIPRPKDEIPGEWHLWRNRMWETVIVLAVFSDARGLLHISSDATFRGLGVILALVALLIYFSARGEIKREQSQNPLLPFPVNGIYRSVRFPNHLADVISSFGTALIFNSWAGLFVAFLNVLIMIGYVVEQDGIMARKHGEDWLIYQGRVSRWIPMVW